MTDASPSGGTGYPLVLDGTGLQALVVGGGPVAARKARALAAAGAHVRIIAPEIGEECRELGREGRITLRESAYESSDIGDALLIVAATDAPDVNARVAADARRLHRLVNVVDDPGAGNCVSPATHHAGALAIAVTTGGVPGAAVRIRDALAARFDQRYAEAVATLRTLRDRLLRERGRKAWHEAADALIGEDFCEAVESGRFRERAAKWR